MDAAKVLAVIPARGGSKGIPRKNLRMLGGQPLVARTVQQARSARRVGRVVVSTDDGEIAATARQAGAEVVNRPATLSSDEASSEVALLHVLEYLESQEDYRPEVVVFLQCTSPFTRAADIDGAIETLVGRGADSVLSAAPSHLFLWKQAADGSAVGVNHDPRRRLRRQEREVELVETGAVYVMRADGFRAAKHRFFGRTVLHEVPRELALEIDDPCDLRLAEMMIRAGADSGAEALPDPVAAVVFDFDGVMTDNRVFVGSDGNEAVACSREDGWGIGELRRSGVPMVVISTERNPVVRARCQKLGLECVQDVTDKLGTLRAWVAERAIDLTQVVFLGNDCNDLECLRAVGCGAVVSDAHPVALEAAKLVLKRPGGRGAVRELSDMILSKVKGTIQ